MPRVNDSRTVTERVLSILAAFSRSRAELTLTEICQVADLTPATAYRRVRELVNWGALEQGDDGKYRVGLRLWELASLAPRGMPLRELALPFLGDLVSITGGNSQLAVRVGHEALFLDRLRGRNDIRAVAEAANRLPLPLTAVGLLLLAFSPRELQEEVLSGPLPAITTHTMTKPSEIRAVLADVRRNGYSCSDQQLEPGTFSTAAPVYDSHGQVVAALGNVTWTAQNRNNAIGTVVAAARSLSRLLGADLETTARGHSFGV